MKYACRDRRQHGKPPVQYKIEAHTSIKSVPIEKLLSHIKTKASLTEYLSKELIKKINYDNKSIIVSYKDTAEASKVVVSDLKSTQEEADTKIILHALHATGRGANVINVFSPDTDVFVLLINWYPQLPTKIFFFIGNLGKLM